jgi:hypothetical protein
MFFIRKSYKYYNKQYLRRITIFSNPGGNNNNNNNIFIITLLSSFYIIFKNKKDY